MDSPLPQSTRKFALMRTYASLLYSLFHTFMCDLFQNNLCSPSTTHLKPDYYFFMSTTIALREITILKKGTGHARKTVDLIHETSHLFCRPKATYYTVYVLRNSSIPKHHELWKDRTYVWYIIQQHSLLSPLWNMTIKCPLTVYGSSALRSRKEKNKAAMSAQCLSV